jgi:hypothetical protein
MDSLQVRTGQISLRILDDDGEERGIFRFNPKDIESAKRVILLQDELNAKLEEYSERNEKCKTAEERVELLSESVNYLRGIIDDCFGEGTSDIVFGTAHTLTMFSDFIEGITPYYTAASKERTNKYRKSSKKA